MCRVTHREACRPRLWPALPASRRRSNSAVSPPMQRAPTTVRLVMTPATTLLISPAWAPPCPPPSPLAASSIRAWLAHTECPAARGSAEGGERRTRPQKRPAERGGVANVTTTRPQQGEATPPPLPLFIPTGLTGERLVDIGESSRHRPGSGETCCKGRTGRKLGPIMRLPTNRAAELTGSGRSRW